MTLLYILCVCLATAFIVSAWLLTTSKKNEAAAAASRDAALNTLSETEEAKRKSEAAASVEINEKNERVTVLTAELARANMLAETLKDQIDRDKQELEKLQASFRMEFRNMANEILDEKTLQFKKTNKEELDVLLKPFKDNISDFRERVEKIYSEENVQRGALQNEIKNLQDLNRRITEETNSLTNALKGNSKVQGDWGEMILQTILENSHLIKGVHYTTQQNLKDEQGNNLRPDVILHLPDEKQVVIDSKVSLTSYVGYCSEEDPETKAKLLKDHLVSVRRHVDELGSKKYQELVNSPDFVIMFVPNEPAFMCALQNDADIWNSAYNKKVIVSSPTNLFALLKIVDDLWKRDDQSRNAIEIAEAGGRLYDKFVGFIETLEVLGKNITNAQVSYDKAMNQLATGSGNLVGRTEKLRKLGVKATKAMKKDMVVKALEEESAEDLTDSDAHIAEEDAKALE